MDSRAGLSEAPLLQWDQCIKIREGAALEQPGRELCARGARSTAGTLGCPRNMFAATSCRGYPEEDTQAAVRTAQAAVPSVPRGLQFQLLSEDTGVHFSAL